MVICLLLVAISLQAQEKGKWIPIDKTTEVEVKQKDGSMAKEKRGFRSIAIDRITGDFYGFLPNSGVWKSTDMAKTFKLSYEVAKGGCGSSFSMCIDPSDGKRLMLLLAGGPSALTLDGGATWKPVKNEGLWVTVDFSDPEAKTMASRYGGHSEWKISGDQGQTWKSIKTKEWAWTVGIFDSKTWVAFGDVTVDGGASYKPFEGDKVNARVPAVMPPFKGTAYVAAKGGFAVTKDKGKTWTLLATPKEPDYGVYFGKDENHLIMATRGEGFWESKDAGKTWKNVMSFPFPPHDVPTQGDHGGVGTCGYDPVHDIFYYCTSGQLPQKYQR